MSRRAHLSRTDTETAVTELRTARDFIRWAASRFGECGVFFGHGTDNAVDEATALVLHALHLEPGVPDELLRGQLTRGERARLADLIARRINERVPAPYLTHKAWFAGVPFYVDERVLVPRSPIGEWIERGFAPWVVPAEVGRVLDLGTGSGCLAIACALAFPQAVVDAVDISPEALEVARINIHDFGLEGRVRPAESDLFGGITGVYDLIVANPPYVDEGELARMPPEYRHEPGIGLAAGDGGLQFIRRILDEAGAFLLPHGVLVVDVGASREALLAAYGDLPFIWLEFARGGDDVFLLPAESLR